MVGEESVVSVNNPLHVVEYINVGSFHTSWNMKTKHTKNTVLTTSKSIQDREHLRIHLEATLNVNTHNWILSIVSRSKLFSIKFSFLHLIPIDDKMNSRQIFEKKKIWMLYPYSFSLNIISYLLSPALQSSHYLGYIHFYSCFSCCLEKAMYHSLANLSFSSTLHSP